MIYDLSHFNAKLKFLPHFHSTLYIENDSADGASVYLEHILVKRVMPMETLVLRKIASLALSFVQLLSAFYEIYLSLYQQCFGQVRKSVQMNYFKKRYSPWKY